MKVTHGKSASSFLLLNQATAHVIDAYRSTGKPLLGIPRNNHTASGAILTLYIHTMTYATIDFETYSEAGFEWSDASNKWVHPEGGSATNRGLGLVGVVNYTQHPSFEVLCGWYKLPGGELIYWQPGMPAPQDFFDYVAKGGIVEAHNHGFEHRVFQALGWPEVPLAQQRCSMAKSRAWALPASLDSVSQVLGTRPKNPDGKKGIQLFSMPRKPTKGNPARRLSPGDSPLEFKQYIIDYCADDVLAEESASAIVPELTPIELEHWYVDQLVNRRGVGVDVQTLYACRQILRDAYRTYGDRCRAITGGVNPSEVSKLIGWASENGVRLSALDDEAITDALGRDDLPYIVRQMLICRSAVASASVKKVHAMLNAQAGGRLYDLFQFHGARTGRCIAEGSLVMTDRGEMPIEQVTIDDRLWDGDQWVKHGGVIYSGEKDVIEHDGIKATPDHLVLVSTNEYTTLEDAQVCGISIFRGESCVTRFT